MYYLKCISDSYAAFGKIKGVTNRSELFSGNTTKNVPFSGE